MRESSSEDVHGVVIGQRFVFRVSLILYSDEMKT